jgi:hypothetical protein
MKKPEPDNNDFDSAGQFGQLTGAPGAVKALSFLAVEPQRGLPFSLAFNYRDPVQPVHFVNFVHRPSSVFHRPSSAEDPELLLPSSVHPVHFVNFVHRPSSVFLPLSGTHLFSSEI